MQSAVKISSQNVVACVCAIDVDLLGFYAVTHFASVSAYVLHIFIWSTSICVGRCCGMFIRAYCNRKCKYKPQSVRVTTQIYKRTFMKFK